MCIFLYEIVHNGTITMVAAQFVETGSLQVETEHLWNWAGENGIKGNMFCSFMRCESGGINLDPRSYTSLQEEPLRDKRSICKDADC